jgi:hypothetical protein
MGTWALGQSGSMALWAHGLGLMGLGLMGSRAHGILGSWGALGLLGYWALEHLGSLALGLLSTWALEHLGF